MLSIISLNAQHILLRSASSRAEVVLSYTLNKLEQCKVEPVVLKDTEGHLYTDEDDLWE